MLTHACNFAEGGPAGAGLCRLAVARGLSAGARRAVQCRKRSMRKTHPSIG